MLNSFKIYKTHRGISFWAIPKKMISELGLKTGQRVELKCGSLSIDATVVPRRSKVHMGLSEEIFHSLKLPDNLSLSIKGGGN